MFLGMKKVRCPHSFFRYCVLFTYILFVPSFAQATSTYCKDHYSILEILLQGQPTKELIVARLGNPAEIIQEMDGQRWIQHFDAGWDHSPFAKYPDFQLAPYFEELKPGYSFLGPDGARWNFLSMDEKGVVVFESNKKQIRWRSGYEMAHTYQLRYPKLNHTVRVVIPTLKNGERDQKSLDWVQYALANLPIEGIQNLETVRINNIANKWDSYWGETYKKSWMPKILARKMFTSAATAGSKEIDVYPAGKSSDMVNLFRHELGHLLAEGKYGSTMPDQVWKEAMKKDGKAVSSYAKNSDAEDFAETVMYYLLSEGGTHDSTVFKPMHQKFAARFALLDEYFKVNPAEKRALDDRLRNIRRFAFAGGAGLAFGASFGSTYLIFAPEE